MTDAILCCHCGMTEAQHVPASAHGFPVCRVQTTFTPVSAGSAEPTLDTKRLDWLEANAVHLSPILTMDDDEEMAWRVCPENSTVSEGRTLREALDKAQASPSHPSSDQFSDKAGNPDAARGES